MPKAKVYPQKFRKEWLSHELLKDWLMEIPDNPLKVRCRICQCQLKVKLNDLQNHAKSTKHQKNTTPSKSEEPADDDNNFEQSTSSLITRKSSKTTRKSSKKTCTSPITTSKSPITTRKSSRKTRSSSRKTRSSSTPQLIPQPMPPRPSSPSCSFETALLECRLSLLAASHATSIDHLAELLKISVSDSLAITDLTICEDKYSNIIKNVLSAHFRNDLAEDIGDGCFSLILDESSISIDKILGVAIVYYSRRKNKVVSTFFSMVQLQDCAPYGIIKALKNAISRRNLNLDNLVGIATDNQNDMLGINGEVYDTLKTELPTLIFFRCICNSIRSAISYACTEHLPKNLEFLIAETYKWFSVLTSRQDAYEDLCESLNVAEMISKLPDDPWFKWMTNEIAVGKIIEQWAKLKQHFEVAQKQENCYIAEVLYKIYEDETNMAYVLFYHSILVEVQTVNNLFESKMIDKVKLLDDLTLLIQSTARKLLLPTAEVNAVSSDIEAFLDPNPRLGYKAEKKIEELRQTNKITEDEEMLIRKNYQQFLLTLFQQLKQRLPYDLDILRKISFLSVSKALQPVKEPLANLMERLQFSEEKISVIESQWAKLHSTEWKNRDDTEAFWNEVLEYKDESGANPFEELSRFASKLLVLPHSDEEVKKLFSCVRMARSKVKNKTELKMENALLNVKFGLSRDDKCCNTYAISEDSVHAIMNLREEEFF